MSPAASLPARLEAHLNERPDLLPRGSRVLVALSGGPDSMALLDLLTRLRDRLDIRLRAAHFDHRVRAGSDAEAETVAGWASELGVACRIGSAPVGESLPESTRRRTTQAALRDLRYAFLHAEAERTSSRRLVTAHHSDDQAETVLFRMMRGTGLRGLAGIPGRRGRIVRPLLPFGRRDLEEHLRAVDIPFLSDPSNRDPRWARARVRHQALPALERSWPGDPASRFAALARTASRADAALDELAWRLMLSARREARPADATREDEPADRWSLAAERSSPDVKRWSFSVDRLAQQEAELLARGLRRLARQAGVRLRAGGTEAGVQFIKQGRSGAEIDLGGGLRMWREFATIGVGGASVPHDDQPLAVTSRDSDSGSLLLGGRRYRVDWWAGEDREPGGESVAVPSEVLRFPLELRARRPGDRIRLATGSRALKRLFNDRRVPKGERGSVPVLACGSTVLWAFGVAVADGLRAGCAQSGTESELNIRIVPADGAYGARTGTCKDR